MSSTPGKKWLRRAVFDVANTANAYRPFDRRGWGSGLSFALGLNTSELSTVGIAGEALLSLNAIRKGALREPAGKAALVLQAASLAGLWHIGQVGAQSAKVLSDALVGALGPDTPSPEALSKQLGIAKTFRIRKDYVDIKSPVQYGPYGRNNVLDVWRRNGLPKDGKAPVLLQIPGGGWVTGSREVQGYPLMSYLANNGWICVAINYSLAPKHKWPAQIVDVKRALAWVKEHIADYGGDPDFVCITGGSAGGHLSSLAALTPNDPEWQPGFEDADTSVRAAVPFYGAYDFTDRDGLGHKKMIGLLEKLVVGLPIADNRAVYDKASPMSQVNADAPPFFVLHGTGDSLIPVEQGDDFVRLLRGVSKNPVAYARLPHAQHAFDIYAGHRGRNSAVAVGAFLEHVRAEAGQPR